MLGGLGAGSGEQRHHLCYWRKDSTIRLCAREPVLPCFMRREPEDLA